MVVGLYGNNSLIIFVENLAGLFIVAQSPAIAAGRNLVVLTTTVSRFASAPLRIQAPSLILPPGLFRLVKQSLSFLQFPVIQQDPCGKVFKYNRWKRVLSDGLLTEFLISQLEVQVNEFHSMLSVEVIAAEKASGCGIIGSNWMEFGCMTETAYRAHLVFLSNRYPDAVYFCHPKEVSTIPEQTFGVAKVKRLSLPVEAWMMEEGVPELIVTVCSSSVLALTKMRQDVKIDLIQIDAEHFDGPNRATIYRLYKNKTEQRDILVKDLQLFLFSEMTKQGLDISTINQSKPSR